MSWKTQNSSRPELEALEVNAPEGYIGNRLYPKETVAQKTGTIYYAPAGSKITAEQGRDPKTGALKRNFFGSANKMVNVYDFGSVKILGVTMQVSSLVTLGVTVVVMVILTLFIKYTRLGRAMIAVSEDKGAAQLMGINVNGIITVTFAIGSALAALAGLFYLLKAPSISSTLGAMPGIKAFTAAVIGGIGSIPGAMLGGILLGLVECISYKITAIAPYTDAIEFSILIIILLVRPTGFLGKKRREKV